MGLPPGQHGYHVHAVGNCDPGDFMTAEGHFNPTNKEHGLHNPLGSHVGDLPNLIVADDGTASMTAVASYATLAPSDTSLFDMDGSALVIHAGADDEVTDPAGNSGARIACGVLGAGPAHTEDGQLFVNEPMGTQDAFRDIWGKYAAEQWVLERNAQLIEARRAES
jgi:Cu-Zn family superoxide dismutase